MSDSIAYRVEELLGPLNTVEKKNAPARLYVAGDTGILALGARVSIVGSRHASEGALALAGQVAERLAERGVVVVSGLAEGIDTAAHTGAIESGGRTIAVLGTSLSETYPAKNRMLQDRIIREHLAISQFAPGTPLQPTNFPQRNRTMALIGDATVIVEAGSKSGTAHQGWEALRLGRPLFLTPAVLASVSDGWPQEMVRYGAQVLTPEVFEALFDMLPERSGAEPTSLAL